MTICRSEKRRRPVIRSGRRQRRNSCRLGCVERSNVRCIGGEQHGVGSAQVASRPIRAFQRNAGDEHHGDDAPHPGRDSAQQLVNTHPREAIRQERGQEQDSRRQPKTPYPGTMCATSPSSGLSIASAALRTTAIRSAVMCGPRPMRIRTPPTPSGRRRHRRCTPSPSGRTRQAACRNIPD